jgi:hypothetical protein
MPLDRRLLDSVVCISSAGDLLGSGSIVSVRSEATPQASWPYVVTAHHVVAKQVLVEIEVPDPLTNGPPFTRLSGQITGGCPPIQRRFAFLCRRGFLNTASQRC